MSCVRSSPWPTWSSPSWARPRPHHHVLQVSHCWCVRSSPWPTWSSPSCCSTSPPPSRSTSKSLRRVVCTQLTMAYVVVPFVARPRPHHHVRVCTQLTLRGRPLRAARPRPHHHVLQVSHCVVSCVRSSPWPTWSSPSCCSTSPPPSRSTSKSLRRVYAAHHGLRGRPLRAARPRPHHHVLQVSHCVVCRQLTMAYVVVPFVLLDLAPPSRSTSKSLRRVVCTQLTMAYVVVPFVLLDIAPTITFYK